MPGFVFPRVFRSAGRIGLICPIVRWCPLNAACLWVILKPSKVRRDRWLIPARKFRERDIYGVGSRQGSDASRHIPATSFGASENHLFYNPDRRHVPELQGWRPSGGVLPKNSVEGLQPDQEPCLTRWLRNGRRRGTEFGERAGCPDESSRRRRGRERFDRLMCACVNSEPSVRNGARAAVEARNRGAQARCRGTKHEAGCGNHGDYFQDGILPPATCDGETRHPRYCIFGAVCDSPRNRGGLKRGRARTQVVG